MTGIRRAAVVFWLTIPMAISSAMMPEMVDKVADLFGKNKKDDDGTAR